MIKHLKSKPGDSVSTPSADAIKITNPDEHTTTSYLISYLTNVIPNFVVQRKAKVSDKTLENAVYNYLRSLKTVGRESIGVEEMADALCLPVHKIKEISCRLKSKGVKLE